MKVKVQMHLRISWFRCDSMHEFMIHNGVSNCETNQIHPISKCEIAVLTFHQIRLDFICMLQFNANIFIVNCNEKAHSWCLAKKIKTTKHTHRHIDNNEWLNVSLNHLCDFIKIALLLYHWNLFVCWFVFRLENGKTSISRSI